MTIGGYSRRDPIRHKKYVVCSTAKRGAGCTFIQWNMGQLEPTILEYLREIDLTDLLEDAEDGRTLQTLIEKRLALQHEVNETAASLRSIVKAIETGGNLKTLVARVSELENLSLSLGAKLSAIDDQIRVEESAEESVQYHQHALAELSSLEKTAGKLRVGAIRLRLAQNIKQLVKAIYVYAGGMNVETHYDDAGNPLSHKLLSVDRDSRLVLIWFRSGNIARQIVDGSTSGRSDSFDLQVRPELLAHTDWQLGRH